jgi:DNA-binding LacI/PurR family transcriptional regulator
MVRRDTSHKKSSRQRRNRPSVKRDNIELTLRTQIVSGMYAPGHRLPLRRDMEQQFHAGPVTVQRALDRLSSEGFIQSRGRRGTFVTDHPPHLCRYAVIFPKPLGSPDWNRFWTALSGEARRLEQAWPHLSLPIFHGIEDYQASKDYQPLLDAIESDRLAGLIFPAWPGFAEGTPLMKPGLPRVAVATEHRWQGITLLALDGRGLIDKALDRLAARGRRRVAVISLPLFAECHENYITSAAAARGLTIHSHWLQGLIPAHPKCVQNCATLLMHAGQSERPDGLLIADDNLIEPVTAGLVAAGVRVPEDLEIVGHCNFHYPTPAHLPVTRLGYDTCQILRWSIESIDRQRSGQKEPVVINVPALFESEVSPVPWEEPSPQKTA